MALLRHASAKRQEGSASASASDIDPPSEWIDAQLEIHWQKDHSEPQRRLAALYRLQTLAWTDSGALRLASVHIGGAPLESGHYFESQTIQRIQNVFGRTLSKSGLSP